MLVDSRQRKDEYEKAQPKDLSKLLTGAGVFALLIVVVIIVRAVFFGQPNDGVEPGVIVRGRIVKSGQPLVVPNREVGLGNVEVILVPIGGGNAGRGTGSRVGAEDGSFEIVGPGLGVRPGTWRLAVYQQDQGYGSDMLEGAFSEEASPITIEVPADERKTDLGTIDLGSFSN